MPDSPTHHKKYVWGFSMGEVHGGLKARLDSEAILRDFAGWDYFDTSMVGSPVKKIVALAKSILWLLRQPRDTLFFVQYPLHGGRAQKLVANIMFRRNKTLVLLHDFDELRLQYYANPEPLLPKATYIISTGGLLDRVKDPIAGIPTTVLEIWDYLVPPGFVPGGWDPKGPLLFAGSLWPEKVGWLYKKGPRPPLLLRGRGYVEGDNPGLGDTIGAPFDPQNPSFEPPVAWGLVWDGHKLDSTNTDADYERINQPHKFSLYLACGLPLIAWSEGQAAKWVLKNGCGITVPSLAAIPEALGQVTPAEHETMRKRAQDCGERVRKGKNLLEAVERLGI